VRGEPADEAEIVAAGKEALNQIVLQQISTGLDIINNGEQQRESFVLYLRHRLSGIGGQSQRQVPADLDSYPIFKRAQQKEATARFSVSNFLHTPKAIGEIKYLDSTLIDHECNDFASVLGVNQGRYAEAFFTAPSPGIVATLVENAHYDGMESYLAALSEALRIEYEAIVGSGFVLQLDCPDVAMERHIAFRDRPQSEFLEFVEMAVEAINKALRNVPSERVRMHVCWGNYEGPHDQDVPLADVATIVRRANVGGFVLPFANGRHAHEYRIFEKAPLKDEQILVAGVIDTLSNVVEHPEVIADRIERVATLIGDPRQVLAGTDCGFDTSAGNSRVTSDVAWAKLRALSEGARIASRRLFGG